MSQNTFSVAQKSFINRAPKTNTDAFSILIQDSGNHTADRFSKTKIY